MPLTKTRQNLLEKIFFSIFATINLVIIVFPGWYLPKFKTVLDTFEFLDQRGNIPGVASSVVISWFLIIITIVLTLLLICAVYSFRTSHELYKRVQYLLVLPLVFLYPATIVMLSKYYKLAELPAFYSDRTVFIGMGIYMLGMLIIIAFAIIQNRRKAPEANKRPFITKSKVIITGIFILFGAIIISPPSKYDLNIENQRRQYLESQGIKTQVKIDEVTFQGHSSRYGSGSNFCEIHFTFIERPKAAMSSLSKLYNRMFYDLFCSKMKSLEGNTAEVLTADYTTEKTRFRLELQQPSQAEQIYNNEKNWPVRVGQVVFVYILVLVINEYFVSLRTTSHISSLSKKKS